MSAHDGFFFSNCTVCSDTHWSLRHFPVPYAPSIFSFPKSSYHRLENLANSIWSSLTAPSFQTHLRIRNIKTAIFFFLLPLQAALWRDCPFSGMAVPTKRMKSSFYLTSLFEVPQGSQAHSHPTNCPFGCQFCSYNFRYKGTDRLPNCW